VNLQPIPRSSSELAHLDKRRFGYGLGQSPLAYCINIKPARPEVCVVEHICRNPVYTGNGFADVDGAPFKAYYCRTCAAAILNLSSPPKDPPCPA